MDVTAFCTKSSVLVVVGKGGVGKSTLSATVARLAARNGLSVLLVELEGKSGPGGVFGRHVMTSDEVELSAVGTGDLGARSAPIRVRTITPEGALADYLVDHGFGRAARRLAKSGMLDVVATAIPGVRDVLVLGKIVQLERANPADLIVVDGPAAGHATTFLSSAQGLLHSSRAGPLHALAADVVELLSDPTRCQVVLVTLAEETPVNETVETAVKLQDQVGMYLGPVIVNCLYPLLDHLEADPETAATAAGVTLRSGEAEAMRAAASFRRRRQEMQAVQAIRLAEALPLPQLWLPQLFAPQFGLAELELLADAMESGLLHLRRTSRPRRLDGPDQAGIRYPSAPTCRRRHECVVVNGLSALIRERRIIVCGGSGGVGKTTIAAALAVEGARQGRRTCVVTIDPARRLADAFGLDSLTNTPRRVDGAWPGELWALMLDTKSTFDEALIRYARDPTQVQAIHGSRIYRNLCDALSGTQEYMAVEKLYQLNQEGGFDLIVVDTPPTRRAMDFLNAPYHLTRLLDNPAIRILVMPSRAYLRAVSFAAQAPLRAIGKIVGAETVLETVAFLRAFEGMEAGIRNRAKRVDELFAEPTTAFVLVVAPRQDAIDEAQFFAARLRESDIPVQALIINRLHPDFDAQPDLSPPMAADRGLDWTQRHESVQAFATLNHNWEELCEVAEREENYVTALAAQVAPAPVGRVPLLDGDVHDLDGVQTVADHLFGLRHSNTASSIDGQPKADAVGHA